VVLQTGCDVIIRHSSWGTTLGRRRGHFIIVNCERKRKQTNLYFPIYSFYITIAVKCRSEFKRRLFKTKLVQTKQKEIETQEFKIAGKTTDIGAPNLRNHFR
jgi:hypothetical protein